MNDMPAPAPTPATSAPATPAQPDLSNPAALRAHLGPVSPLAERKVLPRLDAHARHFIALSPFLVVATADTEGGVDASPRGDPPGFVQVLDDTTLFLPDRPGNNRLDSFRNLLANPGIGLLFMVPGVEETLRVNGTARLSTAADLLANAEVAGRIPRTGLVITVTELFFHCAKALKRSRLWHADAQIERSAFPSLARIIADQQNVDAAETEQKLEVAYRTRMY